MNKRIKAAVKKNLASLALLSVELVIVLILFICALVIFTVIAYGVFKLQYQQFDFIVFDKVARLVTPGMTGFIRGITFFGNHMFLIPANLVLVIYFLFVRKHKWYSIRVPVVAIGGVILMALLKEIFNRPRPLIPLLAPVKGLSFPSGHAMMSVSFYGLLIFLVWENITNRTLKWVLTILLLLFILLIGFSRIYLRLHYFSDVIAGFAAGIIWLTVSLWTIRRFELFSKRKIDPIIEDEIAKA
jgi:membrane-associated phospholipid phosphatase